MLQCDWPKVWSLESREAVRVAVERSIRSAMAGSKNSQIRGLVNVDLPQLGSSPPELVLSGIRELSVERTAIMVKLRYSGEFSMTLRGLQINLDTIGSSGEEADANLALPFYCPFEMTLHDIMLDGVASIELLQELQETGLSDEEERLGAATGSSCYGGTETEGRGTDADRTPRFTYASRLSNEALLSSASGAPAGGTAREGSRQPSGGGSTAAGYGVLLSAGGRRAMRPPEVLAAHPVVPGGPSAPPRPGAAGSSGAGLSLPPGPATGAPAQPTARRSLTDLLSHRCAVKRRTLKVQLFGDPIKSLSVASNFSSVIPGANSKVEGTIKMLIKPTIERMMSEGISIVL